MKFLIDHQLPKALSRYLQQRGFDSQHVFDLGLAESLDSAICRYARDHDCIIISKDEDFFYLTTQANAKIRLVWVRVGNCRTAALLKAFDRLWPSIESSLARGDTIVEVR